MPNNTHQQSENRKNVFETPVKPKLRLSDEPDTAAETYDKAHQTFIQNSNTFLNMFKKKRNPKRIKKFTLKLLEMQCQTLQSYKRSLSESYSDSVNESYKQELDKVFVIIARITHIYNDKKYFIFNCQDESHKNFKFYFNKHNPLKEFQTRLFSHSEKLVENRWITNIDELEFESIPGEGIPYFKFFIILREIPIFDKSEQIVLSSEETIDNQSNNVVEDSARKRFLSHIKGTEFRAYVEHFEKVVNFNYLTWHNMHACFENACEQILSNKNEEEIEI